MQDGSKAAMLALPIKFDLETQKFNPFIIQQRSGSSPVW